MEYQVPYELNYTLLPAAGRPDSSSCDVADRE